MAATQILLGPVIGLVNDTSARVLLEVSNDCELVLTATDTKGKQKSAKTRFEAARPGVFKLIGLEPHMRYVLSLDATVDVRNRLDEDGHLGAFTTSNPADLSNMKIGAVSCNDLRKLEKVGPKHWSKLYNDYVRLRAPQHLDLLLHCGDQVYADPSFDEARKILGEPGNTRASAAQKEQIMDLWRNLYRATWNLPGVRETLAHVSNLMIWDDHEIRDDYGFRPEDKDPKSQDAFLAEFARQAYWEYQCQLHRDLKESERQRKHHQAHSHLLEMGRLCVMFLDQRTCRSFLYNPKDSNKYLGSEQWEWVDERLAKGGDFDGPQARALILITSVPLVFLNTRATTFGSKFGVTDDLGDHWAHKESVREQIRMLDTLREWRERGAAAGVNREVLVVGGDVHIGGVSEIYYGDESNLLFRQLTASSIMNVGPSGVPFALLKQAMSNGPTLGQDEYDDDGPRYKFRHGDWTTKPNFGVISVYCQDTVGPHQRFDVQVIKRAMPTAGMCADGFLCCKRDRPVGVADNDEKADAVARKIRADRTLNPEDADNRAVRVAGGTSASASGFASYRGSSSSAEYSGTDESESDGGSYSESGY